MASCTDIVLEYSVLHAKFTMLQELDEVAKATNGMSARDLKAVCEEAERAWVSSIIRGQAAKGSLPPLSAYTAAAKARSSSLRMHA